MSLFDRLSKIGGNKDISLTPKGAFALSAMTIIGIDGSIEEEEIDALQRIVRGDRDAFDQAYKVYKDRSVSECIQVVDKSLNEKQKVAVIANLLDLAMADGMLAGSEEELLTSYINTFQIPDDIVKDIIDVVSIKNDFSVFD